MKRCLLILAGLLCLLRCQGASAPEAFAAAVTAHGRQDYEEAARRFREAARLQPAAGTLVNLGLSQWQRGRVGEAILAWEQARWLDPFAPHARNNLQFARTQSQLEAPELTWYEVASTWLPGDWWAWLVSASLWFVVGMLTLPGILRWRKSAWHQALAALGLAVFLFSLPAHVGVLARTRLGFVIEKDVPLRLTPTAEAEAVTRLTAGEPARCSRTRGDYVFVRTKHVAGWLRQDEFAFVSPR